MPQGTHAATVRLDDCDPRMPIQNTEEIALRPARADDFDYCASLYFAGMEQTIRELKLDLAKQRANLRERWAMPEVRIITCDGADIGWMQCHAENDALFLAQLFVAEPFQRRGIGAEIMRRLIDEAGRVRKAVTLGVVKTNPALRLYQRLGFRITHDDDRKFYMRRGVAPLPV
jgi:GNAT superfamily N-acetyltransferase